jgi:hypothetical protein
MPDEQRKDDETEIEGHVSKASANDERRDEADDDDDVEAHSIRMD